MSVMLLLALATAASPDVPPATACFMDGQAAYASGSWFAAREHFACARANAPTWALAYLHWAMAELQIEPASTEARAALEQAVALQPGNPRAQYYLGLSCARLAQWDCAARALERATALRPELVEAQFLLADAHRAAGSDVPAMVAFERVVQLDPRHLGAWSALAEVYEAIGRSADAERALVTIAGLQPTIAYHHYQLARFYTRTGQAKKAKISFERAEAIDPRPKRKMRQLR